VDAYLDNAGANYLPPAPLWERSGRGIPDISSVAGQLVLLTNGMSWLGGGTSASAPFWGGVWALANEVSKAKSGKPLGPASPLLYHIARTTSCFHDVTEGNNNCPFGPRWEGNTCNCTTCYGFDAAAGWDPVTGLGTPNVSCILDFVERM
jgi:tripeptidyl-peptidase-1